ncbi:MAG: carboxymuconolactone decarboxylase family protein [Desulfobacterium sp.]|nr:carboxymuconolactone decarboxylase family protein [Desulfobacterium sp.]
MDDKEAKKRTGKTAGLYFSTVKDENKPYGLWKHFDKELAADMSIYITGKMYSREKIPHTTRQLITVASLTVLSKPEELNLHIHAALNVGCTTEEIAEVIFQTSIYGGVPAANTALKVLKQVLEEREEGLSTAEESQ